MGLFANIRAFTLAATTAFMLTGGSANAAPTDQVYTALQTGNKALARQIFMQRGIWGHFNQMDLNNDVSLTYPEMERYLFLMHAAFDANNDGVVAVHEAPQILLRYTLSGQPFPAQGLSRYELRNRLQALFLKLDRNRNRHLSLLELR